MKKNHYPKNNQHCDEITDKSVESSVIFNTDTVQQTSGQIIF